ncbi:MAG: hypothetical protein AB8B78_11000 [Polaribacter sp.]
MSIIFLSLVFFAISTFSQNGDFDVEHIYESDNRDFEDLLDFSKIKFNRFILKGDSLSGKKATLISREIKKGKIIKTDTIFNSLKLPYFISMNKYQFSSLRILTKRSEKKNKLSIKFNNYTLSKKVSVFGENDYEILGLFESNKKYPVFNNEFYIFSLCPPYKTSDGWQRTVPTGIAGGDVMKWYKKFKIKHYFIFSMIIK